MSNYNKAIQIDSNDDAAYYSRGFTYNDLKDYSNALADFNKAI